MKHDFITRIVSNLYHVYHNGEIVEAVAMGKLRLGKKPIVGDHVKIEFDGEKYLIQEIYERKNQLVRPYVANVDQVFIVMSALDPEFSYTLVNRLIFLVTYENIKPIIVLSKTDLINDDDVQEIQKEFELYDFISVSKDGGVLNLIPYFKSKLSVLAGQSGVGKSSILNLIDPHLQLNTQVVSKALGRGKHTTRHNQLYEINGGWIADTPGFSSLDFSHIEIERLAQTVPDFLEYIGECKFRNCIHFNEPGCAVKEAVAIEKISKKRYNDYVQCVEMVKEAQK